MDKSTYIYVRKILYPSFMVKSDKMPYRYSSKIQYLSPNYQSDKELANALD